MTMAGQPVSAVVRSVLPGLLGGLRLVLTLHQIRKRLDELLDALISLCLGDLRSASALTVQNDAISSEGD